MNREFLDCWTFLKLIANQKRENLIFWFTDSITWSDGIGGQNVNVYKKHKLVFISSLSYELPPVIEGWFTVAQERFIVEVGSSLLKPFDTSFFD